MSKQISNISKAWRGPGTDMNYNTEQFNVGTFSTPYSNLTNGRLSMDPSIRQLQDEGLGTYLSRSDETRNRFLGNDAAYTRARLNPLREQLATRRGELGRSIGLRGLAGSSFGEQALTNFDIDSSRAIGDAGAIAERENLQAITGLDSARLQAMMGLSQDRFNQELAGLGLSAQQIQMMQQAFESSKQRRHLQAQNLAKGAETFHTLVTDWGDFAKIGGGGQKPGGTG